MLGGLVSPDGRGDEDTSLRIQKAAAAWGRAKRWIQGNVGVNTSTRARVTRAVVQSTLIYGSVTRPLTDMQIRRMDGFLDRVWRL